jgi:hypothetical protein
MADEQQQHYRVVEDRGWAPETGAYGARTIVVAPIGGAGHSPEVNDCLAICPDTGKQPKLIERGDGT